MKKSIFGVVGRLYASFRASIGAFVYKHRDAAVRSFDSSYVSFLLKRFRGFVPYIQNRVIGAFMLTFGVYSTLIAIFKVAFDFGGDISNIYICVCTALFSIPFLFSKGTVATMLTSSHTGRVFSEAIGIRLQILGGKTAYGRANVAFLVGMIFGTLTFVFSPAQVIGAIVLLAAVGIILTYPEASVLFLAVILPFGGGEQFGLLALVGMIAFFIKVFRGKRSISFHHHRAAALIFLFIVFFAEVFSGSVKYTVMMLVYFLLASPDGHSSRAEKTVAAALVSCGCVSALCMAFMAVSHFGNIKSNFEAFDMSGLLLLCAALIPLAASFVVNGTVMPQRTALLCFVSMTALLVVYEKYMYLAAAAFSIILFLFFYRRRAAYATFAILCACYAGWNWMGGSNRIALNTALGFLKNLSIGEDGVLAYIITGKGIDGGFDGSESFYGAVISTLGIIGLVVLISSTVLLFGYILREKNGKGADRSSAVYMRAWAPACSAIVVLICGLGINVWEYDSVYVLFWMLMGVSSALAADSEKKSMRVLQQQKNEINTEKAEITI